MLYLRCTGSIFSNISRIRRVIAEQKIDFVVIDSIAAACGGQPEEAENALRFFDAIRTLKVTSLCVGHTTKIDSNGFIFGSVFWHNAARNIWEVIKDQEEGAKDIDVMLKHRKCNVGPLLPSIGLSIKFEENSAKLRLGGLKKTSPVFASKLSTHDKMAVFLHANGPSSPAEIEAGTAVKDDALRQALKRDRNSVTPEFVVTGDGYRIVKIALQQIGDNHRDGSSQALSQHRDATE